jgi:tetratricopeptide (TPR) repeat protein
MSARCFLNLSILGKKHPQIKLESGAMPPSFGYSAGVFSKSILAMHPLVRALPAKACLALGLLVCAACVGPPVAPVPIEKAEVFDTVTGEIALVRGEPRTAALQYAAAAEGATDLSLIAHASDVTSECLQPSLTAAIAVRWLTLDPKSLEAHRAAAHAALALGRIDESARQYQIVLSSSPRGTDAEFKQLEIELEASDDVFAARRLADRLAADFPSSVVALRLQGLAALRADDPAPAVGDFSRALALLPAATSNEPAEAVEARRELQQGLWRARILSGDAQEPLEQSRALAEHDATPANILNYALLLLAAHQDQAAVAQLEVLARDPESQPVALRLLGLVEFQNGDLDAAGRDFTKLLTTGKYVDESFYYLGVIAERHADLEKALRLYAQVQGGDNAAAALVRASTILQTHGAAPAAQEILDHLIEDEPARAPEVVAARAKIYADAGDARQALAVLGRGREQYPDSVDLRYAIATTDEEAGHVGAALQELNQVLKQRPDDPAALNAYGYTLADHNRKLARARMLIERAYAAAPRNAAILDSLGWVLYRQGHDDQALPYSAAAYAEDRGADIGAHYGEVLWHLGRHAEADQIWTEAARADSDNHLLNETRRRLHASVAP